MTEEIRNTYKNDDLFVRILYHDTTKEVSGIFFAFKSKIIERNYFNYPH